jgi:deoxyribodipyrimidine photo-lyase
MPTAIVWLRHDLRLADNPALYHAAADADAVVPLFVWAPDEEGDWPPGGAHRWWLSESLASLDASLREKASRLTLREGPSLEALRSVIEATGADRVYWNARLIPALRERDERVREALRESSVEVKTFAGRILHDPEQIRTTTGGPYHVYTPFWKKFQKQIEVGEPLGVPRLGQTRAPASWPESLEVGDLPLTPEQQDGVDWAGDMRECWEPGEAGARKRLDAFLDSKLTGYPEGRNRPDQDLTSLLSPYLHHGEISVRQAWKAADVWATNGATREAANKFLSELAWREFSYHLLWHYPEMPERPLKDKFGRFEWTSDDEALEAWKRGRTGYPIVDAAMRQLYQIGWMHNRCRMIVASFLTKDLLLPWQEGERWFWDTLCGGDLANNSNGWQWSAGSGADAQPFFRIFNPVGQGERWDPEGRYVRHWLPELKDLPKKYVHKPWEAPAHVLEMAGVTLGQTYPRPIVEHSAARDEALARYKAIK